MIRILDTGRTLPGVAYEVGQKGLKLETQDLMGSGHNLEIAFPNTPEHVRCFARVVWCRPLGRTRDHETGVSIIDWHGIVKGDSSWKKFKGFKPKKERRTSSR